MCCYNNIAVVYLYEKVPNSKPGPLRTGPCIHFGHVLKRRNLMGWFEGLEGQCGTLHSSHGKTISFVAEVNSDHSLHTWDGCGRCSRGGGVWMSRHRLTHWRVCTGRGERLGHLL
jgi:hypothetical protein